MRRNGSLWTPAALLLLCPLAASRSVPVVEPASALASAALPISFEPNRGQVASPVRFLARGPGFRLALTPSETLLAVGGAAPSLRHDAHRRAADPPKAGQPSVLRMRLLGTNPNAPEEGLDPLPGKVNYLIGRDPSRWRTRIPTFARVRRRGVYPGIDVVYYGHGDSLEHDFVVQPGASPEAIRVEYSGAEGARLDANGDLVLRTAAGEVRQRKPVVYQEAEGRRVPVVGEYQLTGCGSRAQVAFAVGEYDRARTLVIDPVLDLPLAPAEVGTLGSSREPPVLDFSTYLGGPGGDGNYLDGPAVIAADAAGYVYVAGGTLSSKFPTTGGAFQTTDHSSYPVTVSGFITKLSPDGSSLVYSTYLGGSDGDTVPRKITIDPVGAAYVTGEADASDFPTTDGAYMTAAPGGTDSSFVAKLAPDGSRLVYSTYFPAATSSLALDASGSVYLTGDADTGFPTTPGAFQTTYISDQSAAFVTKVTPDGSGLVYSTLLSGSTLTYGTGIAVDGSDAAYVVGVTAAADFPTTPGAFQPQNNDAGDGPGFLGGNGFVSKLSADGASLAFSTFLGGSAQSTLGYLGDSALDVAVPRSGDSVTVVGATSSSDFPTTPGSFCPVIRGDVGSIGFAARLAGDGRSMVFSTFLPQTEFADGVALDFLGGSTYVCGVTGSPRFRVTQDAVPGSDPTERRDAGYLVQLSPLGDRLLFSTFFARLPGTWDTAVATDGKGGAYLAGFARPGLPVTPHALQKVDAAAPLMSAFAAKFTLQTAFSLAGRVTRGGRPAAGVRIRAGNTEAVTDAKGNYQLNGLPVARRLTVRPSKSRLVFFPSSVTIYSHRDVAGLNFQARAAG